MDINIDLKIKTRSSGFLNDDLIENIYTYI